MERSLSFRTRLRKDIRRYKLIYLMAIPLVLYYTIFHYGTMYGAIIAFKNYSPGRGIWGSPWVGLKHFESFFGSIFAGRVIRNTLYLSLGAMLVGFPTPIILALLLNELRSDKFKRVTQTISYLPHFISLMVICGMIIDFTSSEGLFNDIVAFFGGKRVTMLLREEYFRPIYIISDVWQGIGWGSIVYLSALSGIDPALYEAATIDGAGRFRRMWHITLPGITNTIVVMLILRLGRVMNIGFEKIILLYNPSIYETADVISSFVYRKGLQDFNYSFSTAVGLFNSLINTVLVVSMNMLSRRYSDTSLW